MAIALQREIANVKDILRKLDAHRALEAKELEDLLQENASLRAEVADLRALCVEWSRKYLDVRECYEGAFAVFAAAGDKHAVKFMGAIAAARFAPKPKEPTP